MPSSFPIRQTAYSLDELSCSGMPSTTHCTDHTQLNGYFLFSTPTTIHTQKCQVTSNRNFLSYSTSRQLHGGSKSFLREPIHFFNAECSRRCFNSGALIPTLFEILSLIVTTSLRPDNILGLNSAFPKVCSVYWP